MTLEETLRELRAGATRPRRIVPIVCDGTVQQQIEELDEQIDRLEASPTTDKRITARSVAAQAAQLTAERDQLAAQVADKTLHLVLEGLPGTEYRALLSMHPPRPDTPGDLWGANEQTVRVPLVRACVIGVPDPDVAHVAPIDAETLDWLLGTDGQPEFVTDRQMDDLVAAALAVNRRADAVPLRRRPSPTTPPGDE